MPASLAYKATKTKQNKNKKITEKRRRRTIQFSLWPKLHDFEASRHMCVWQKSIAIISHAEICFSCVWSDSEFLIKPFL